MATFIETKDADFNTQLGTFCDNVGDVSDLLQLNAGKITQIKKDRHNFAYVLGGVNTYNVYAHSVIGKKNGLRQGKNPAILINIVQPINWAAVIPIDMMAGIEVRFAALIQDCVRSTSYTHEIGVTLGIEKPITPFVPGDGTPDTTASTAGGGHPHLETTMGGYSGWAVYKDSGAGYGATPFDKSQYHNWLDQVSPLPAKNVSVVWKYKTRYIYQGVEVGNFSTEIIVTVTGVI